VANQRKHTFAVTRRKGKKEIIQVKRQTARIGWKKSFSG
jgi:hypothetical protein